MHSTCHVHVQHLAAFLVFVLFVCSVPLLSVEKLLEFSEDIRAPPPEPSPPLQSSASNAEELLSRLDRGIGLVNERLDRTLVRIERVEQSYKSMHHEEVSREVNSIVDELETIGQPIRVLFEDVDQLRDLKHAQAEDYYTR